jgi:23S rRNA pseudouridine1911/1915/1917 synthase
MITHGNVEPNALFTITVPETNAADRIDRYITTLFTHYSRSYFQRIIDEGGITINGTIAKKPSAPICPNDIITIQFPAERTIEPTTLADQTLGITILATTEHFMMIHKPANLLVHAPSKNSSAITVADWILHNHNELASVGIVDRPGIIHRLDKETSGLLIITRTNHAHNTFGTLFRTRKIHKTYKAVVAGHPEKEGTITLAIGRDPINRIKMATFNEDCIDETGKIGNVKVRHAKTDYKVIEYFDDAALIEIKPTTGRTHQIRVHMTALGHPIIGDQLYGKKSLLIDRQALHAEQLSFTFDDTSYSFTNEIPADFQQLINSLRTSSKTIKKV